MDVCFDSAEEKLVPLVGRFIIDFVAIEDSINLILNNSRSRLTESHRNNLKWFDDRVNAFHYVLPSYMSSKEEIESLNSVISKIKDMYLIRNLLAHNSVGLAVLRDESGNFKEAGFEISGKRKDIVENLDSLRNKVDELRKLRVQFVKLTECYYMYEVKLMSSA
jgi:dynactin complex subunit